MTVIIRDFMMDDQRLQGNELVFFAGLYDILRDRTEPLETTCIKLCGDYHVKSTRTARNVLQKLNDGGYLYVNDLGDGIVALELTEKYMDKEDGYDTQKEVRDSGEEDKHNSGHRPRVNIYGRRRQKD